MNDRKKRQRYQALLIKQKNTRLTQAEADELFFLGEEYGEFDVRRPAQSPPAEADFVPFSEDSFTRGVPQRTPLQTETPAEKVVFVPFTGSSAPDTAAPQRTEAEKEAAFSPFVPAEESGYIPFTAPNAPAKEKPFTPASAAPQAGQAEGFTPFAPGSIPRAANAYVPFTEEALTDDMFTAPCGNAAKKPPRTKHRKAVKPPKPPKTPKPPHEKKPKGKHWLRNRIILCGILGILLVIGGVASDVYFSTRNDFLWLDLAQLPYRDATVLYAETASGEWTEYARLNATQQKEWVDLENIPLPLQQAFIAVEDKNFYKHHGVSWTRTAYAILNEAVHAVTGSYLGGDSGQKQGASTIVQQLVKNLTLDDDTGGVSGYLRKVREITRALQLDSKYSKDDILEAYLNVIGFTGNTAGVQAESRKLFNRPVNELTLEQCASIAAITKSPYKYDPVKNPEAHTERRNYILYEMWQQGYITEEQYNAAAAAPLGLEPGEVTVPKTELTSYFTDKVIEDVSDDLADKYHLSRAQTTWLLYNGGLRIFTTVDTVLQSTMEATLQSGSFFPQNGLGVATQQPVYDETGKRVTDADGNAVLQNVTEYPQAAMVSVGYDGGLKAVVGGLGQKEVSRGFNRGTDALRQVGSTMKPIGAYALALEKNKINWSTPFKDAPVGKEPDDVTGEMKDWPANFSQSYSDEDILVADALARSINTVAVRVGKKAGIGSIYRFTTGKLGITSFTGADKDAGPMVLGSSTYGVTPYEMAGAYMMFGNGGTFTTLHSYTSLQKATGEEIYAPVLKTQQVLSPATAYIMNRLLRGVLTNGTAAGYAASGTDSVGKTGTSSANRDFWFIGLTPYYCTATWYGYDSGFSLNNTQGTNAPTSAWQHVMNRAQANLGWADFATDDTVITAEYCTETGGLAGSSCPSTRTGYYKEGHLPWKCTKHW